MTIQLTMEMPSVEKIDEMRTKMMERFKKDVPYSKDLAKESLRPSEMYVVYFELFAKVRDWERFARIEMTRVKRLLADYYRGFLDGKQVELTYLQRGPCGYSLTAKELDFYVETDSLLLEWIDYHERLKDWMTDLQMILNQIDARRYALGRALKFLEYKAAVS